MIKDYLLFGDNTKIVLSVQCSILVYCDINEKVHYRTHLDFGKVKKSDYSKRSN